MLIRLFEFFFFMGARENCTDYFREFRVRECSFYWIIRIILIHADNWGMLLWKGYNVYRVAQKEQNSQYSRFSGLCSNQQLLSSLCWIEQLFPIIITSTSSNLVENFLFYETFLMDCHFRDLPDFQSFEARWQINGKSQKWQSIRNYS